MAERPSSVAENREWHHQQWTRSQESRSTNDSYHRRPHPSGSLTQEDRDKRDVEPRPRPEHDPDPGWMKGQEEDECRDELQSEEEEDDDEEKKRRGRGGEKDRNSQRNPDDELYGNNGDEDGDDNTNEDNEDEDDDEDEDEGEDATEAGGENSKSADGSTLVFSIYGARKPAKVRSMFVDKLLKMVEDPSIQHLISWAKEGDMFYVYNCVKLSQYILPKFFKHNNWQSFVRQLNIYRYDREESSMNRKNPETQRWQFYHPHFQREFPHLRVHIKRKSSRSIATAPPASRVVFEHGKGYFLQREERSRSISGEENNSDKNAGPSSPTTDEPVPRSTPGPPVQVQASVEGEAPDATEASGAAQTGRHYSHYATIGSVSNVNLSRTDASRRQDALVRPFRENAPVYPHHNPEYLQEPWENAQKAHESSSFSRPRHTSLSDRAQAVHSPHQPMDARPPHEHPPRTPSLDTHPARLSLNASSESPYSGGRPSQNQVGYFSPQDSSSESHRKREYGQRPEQRQGPVLGSPLGHPDHPSSPANLSLASPRSTTGPGHAMHRSLGSIGEASITSNSPGKSSVRSPIMQDQHGPHSPQGTSVPLHHRIHDQQQQQQQQQPQQPQHHQLQQLQYPHRHQHHDHDPHQRQQHHPQQPHAQEQPHRRHLHHESNLSHPQPVGGHPISQEYTSSQFSHPPPPTPPLPSGNSHPSVPPRPAGPSSPISPTSPARQGRASLPPSAYPQRLVIPPPAPHAATHRAATGAHSPHPHALAAAAAAAAGAMDDPHSQTLELVRGLESRLAFVEDAFTSMKQFTQKLEQIQVSQDRTLGWMRARLEQLCDGMPVREPLGTPPTPQSVGPISHKRKADYAIEETRVLVEVAENMVHSKTALPVVMVTMARMVDGITSHEGPHRRTILPHLLIQGINPIVPLATANRILAHHTRDLVLTVTQNNIRPPLQRQVVGPIHRHNGNTTLHRPMVIITKGTHICLLGIQAM
ncbi:hypothetical protein BGZ94_008256 [Podila epigama]|nr:hypothetical protein BGZ94_008256 [Podila epigama]